MKHGKKIAGLILCLILCSILAAGCGPQKEEETEPVIENDAAVFGTWSEDYFDSGYTFNEDGTGLDIFWDLTFTYTAYDGIITITYDDTKFAVDKYAYTVGENTLSMTRQSGENKSFTYTKQ